MNKNLLFFTFFFSSVIFGPKILSLFDLQLVVSFLAFFFLLNENQFKIYKRLVPLFFILFSIFVFSIFTTIFNGSSDFYFLNRSFRSLLSFIFVTTFLYQTVISGLLSFEIFKKALIFSLTLNSLSILIQAFYPTSQSFFANITLYDKSFYPFKGFGLTAGFDTAGLISSFTAIISFFFYFNKREIFYIFLFSINFFATFFTSRTPMIFLFVVFFILVFQLPKFGIKLSHILIFVFFIIISGLLILVPLLSQTLNLEFFSNYSDLLIYFTFLSPVYFASFAKYQDPLATISEEFVFPKGVNLFLGTAGPSLGDPGYVHAFWLGGYVYFFLIFLFYYFIFLYFIRYKILLKNSYVNKEFSLLLYLLLSMMFLFNFKHFFFFTRGFHDILTITIGFISGYYSLESKNKSII